MARLVKEELVPPLLSEEKIFDRIDAIFKGAEFLRRPNGSLEEAFPYESSFCVTALVSFDLLSAIHLLENRLDENTKSKYLSIVRPMMSFLNQADETHAFISNHLATAAAALCKWSLLTGDPGEQRGRLFLDRILNQQSEEGWFKEYDGADPGYQSLCIYYLADLHLLRPDLQLLEPLQRSIQFLWYFAHPDGSFGGCYASRNTRFYYPAGLEALASEIPEAAALAEFMHQSITHQKVVTLNGIDEPNLIPMFNAYCWATALYKKGQIKNQVSEATIPALSPGSWRKDFLQAGILINKDENNYTIISWHKGGVCYNFKGGKMYINAGVVVRDKKGRLYSTQASQKDNQITQNQNQITVESCFTRMHKKIPSPYHFILLRIFNVSFMRNRWFREWAKKILVWFLITGKKRLPVRNRRTISFQDEINITDELIGNSIGLQVVSLKSSFSDIHMASQGYWQKQDDES